MHKTYTNQICCDIIRHIENMKGGKQMKKVKNIIIAMILLSLVLCTTVFVSDEEIKQLMEFSLQPNNIVYIGEGEAYSRREILPTYYDIYEDNITHWEQEMPVNVLEYDEFLYQIIPLDLEKSKEILQLQQQMAEEMENKREQIEEQIILAQKPNSNITIEQVNVLIDSFNAECQKKNEEFESKLPKYDDNNWKQLEDRKMVYDDPTGNTAYGLVYAKVTYSKFRDEKTVYPRILYPINYNYLSKNQQEEQQQDEEEQKPTEEQNPTQNSDKDNDKTVAPTKLPKARIIKYYNINNNIRTNIKYNFL